eukprot:5795214-Prorocentrum_lima.AAC.1
MLSASGLRLQSSGDAVEIHRRRQTADLSTQRLRPRRRCRGIVWPTSACGVGRFGPPAGLSAR